MKTMKLAALAVLLSVGAAQPSLAKKAERIYPVMNEEMGVPVFPYDIKDRPYVVLGEVKAGVRKATVFSHEASQKKIYKELWERAVKMGADAVINASYGDSHISAFSWGKTNAHGTAIRFTGPSTTPAAATGPAAAPAPAAATPQPN
jgi:uncharacterized protein YbjQ (UPF0145 family)